MQTITLQPLLQRCAEQMALHYKGSALNQLVKRIPGIKWSQGTKCWHLPFNLDSHRLLKTHVANKAELNNELLLAWLQKRNAVAATIPAPPATVTTKTAGQHTAFNLIPKIFITQNYNL